MDATWEMNLIRQRGDADVLPQFHTIVKQLVDVFTDGGIDHFFGSPAIRGDFHSPFLKIVFCNRGIHGVHNVYVLYEELLNSVYLFGQVGIIKVLAEPDNNFRKKISLDAGKTVGSRRQ